MTKDIDNARLAIILNDLRLPAIKHGWPAFAERADKEGWPAARFLATLAEHEIAERDRRRVERHLAEARLLPGKTLDSFNFEVLPMISKAHVMATLARRKPMSRLLPQGSAGAVTHWVPTQWPRIGGVALAPLPTEAFTDPVFTQAYVPGMLTAIYAAGCGYDHANNSATGLVGVARRLKAAIHKVSTTTQTDLRNRLRELNQDRYGALTTSADDLPCSDLGFDSWMMQHILPIGGPLPGSPVAVGDRCLTVRLPADLTPREFDKQLAARMAGARLNVWLDTAAGRKHCAVLGIDPAQFKRGTTYRFNAGMRRSDDAEIYFFRPKTDDADRLLRLAEAIVHAHVMTPASLRRSVSWRSRSQGTRSDFEPAA